MLVAGLLKIKKFNFQGFIMSQTPQNLPKRTRVLVKDILFQEQYRLTHTQVDIMAYIINSMMWATKVDSFFALTNKKFHQDLPQISEKTLEESLRVLKAMELIEVEMITVPSWGNARVRGISVLPKGLEYNASYYKASEKQIIKNLQEEINELKEQMKNLKAIDSEEEQLIEEALDISTKYDNLGFTELIETVTKEFGETSEPICNGVKGWVKETKFYINSYNKLSISTPSGEVIQVKNPVQVNDFWKYLYNNRDQIGKVVDFTKKPTLEELNERYLGLSIVLENMRFKVYKIEEFKNGVKVSIQSSDSGKIATLSRDKEAIAFGLEECETILLGLRAMPLN